MIDLSLTNLRKSYKNGTLSITDVIHYVYEQLESYDDPALWIHVCPREEVLQQAQKLSKDLPLYGVPFAIKDNIDSLGMDTTAACPKYAYTPQQDATVVQKLKEAGALLIGRTNMDQFATGLVGVRSPHGAPRCVFDKNSISGGSSSGSGVVVAAGIVSFSLGTDTAGSGRVPASFNNIVGIKPTKGLISTAGVVPACRSLDCVSIFSVSCSDGDFIRELLEAVDERDPWTRQRVPKHLPLKTPVIGVLSSSEKEFYGDDKAQSLYEDTIERAKTLGWKIQEFDYQPFREAALLLYQGPWLAERLLAFGNFIEEHRDDCDPTVAAILANSPKFSATNVFEGIYRLQEYKARCERQWQGLDALLLPTTPTQYSLDELAQEPISYNSQLGHYTNFVNLLDYAAVAIPAGFRNGLAWGVSVIGPAFSDSSLARLADRLHHTMEAATVGNTGFGVLTDFTNSCPDGAVELAVVGAHLTSMPLNWQLTERNASLLETTKTAKDYKLYALKDTVPAKPGLAKTRGFEGSGIEIEIWSLSLEAFGSFTKEVPPPLAIGSVETQDGRSVKCFVCEGFALEDATDITSFGGWRAYRNSIHSQTSD